ncbi:MAG: FliM/FliN family flagellar motor switch protein [Acidobacteriota bacterium]
MTEQTLAQAIADELGTVVATLLGGESSVRPDAAPPSAVWVLPFDVEGALQGSATLLIPADDAGRLTSKVLGFEDGPPDDAVIDNLQEIAKQIAGSLNIKPEFDGIRLSADQPATSQPSAPGNTKWVEITVGDLTLKAGLSCALIVVHVPVQAAAQKSEPARSSPSHVENPAGPGVPQNLDLILDMELPLWVRFGWTNMTLQDLTKLAPGTTVDLERQPDDPVEVLVNNIVVAKGEVVVVAGNYGVRVTEVMSAQERIRSMGPAS